jgi:hypothetical protein
MFHVTLLIASLLTPVVDEMDNPQYQQWAKFKVGSSVTMKMVTDSGGFKMEMVTTTTLKALTDKEATIEIKSSMVIGGNKMDQPVQEQKIPAKIEKVEVKKVEGEEQEMPKVEEGKESLEIDGKTVACKWTKSTSDMAGSKTVAKIWLSDDVPGNMVKMESTTTGEATATVKSSVTAFTVK